MVSVTRKQFIFAVSAIALILSIFVIGNLPVHRTNILHTDTEGDVTNPNIDIISCRSFDAFDHIVIELVVAGMIISEDIDSEVSSGYLYRLTVTAKGIGDSAAHIYSCTFEDGIVDQFDFQTEIENSTLRIFFSKSAFVSDSYMIGLESSTGYGAEMDYTIEDRNSNIALLIF